MSGAVTASAARTGAWRHVWMTLAVLALAMKVMIPSGFMAAPTQTGGITLVICTGHGPLKIESEGARQGGAGKRAPADKPGHDAPCVFAGHGAAAPAPEPVPTEVARLAPAPSSAAPAPARDLTPGRGLAAPPPPSRGPPSLLI